jgi:glycine oxidase
MTPPSSCPACSTSSWPRSALACVPGSPDNEPVVGTTPVEGLIVATGHHRNGILLTPVTADAVAGLFAVGPTVPEIAGFGPERFAASATP